MHRLRHLRPGLPQKLHYYLRPGNPARRLKDGGPGCPEAQQADSRPCPPKQEGRAFIFRTGSDRRRAYLITFAYPGIAGSLSVGAMFAGAGGGGAAAQGGLLQLHGEASAHLIHDRQHLIEGDELAYAT